MSCTFHVERLADVWDEVYALAQEHQAATQSYRRSEPFNPDKARFLHYNESGFFHFLTCRDNGELAGYFGGYLTTSMHSQLQIVTEDTFYLRPTSRKGRVALRFIRYIEAYFQQFAPLEILFSCEIDNKTGIHGLMKLLAYQPVITVYSKHLSPCADSAITPNQEAASHVSV